MSSQNNSQKYSNMSKTELLTNREFQIDGGWHAPAEYLRSFKSVKQAKYLDTSSSVGDWCGIMVQKLGDTNYVIGFCQTNNFPRGGYSLYTGSVEKTFEGKMTQEQFAEVQDIFVRSFYF